MHVNGDGGPRTEYAIRILRTTVRISQKYRYASTREICRRGR